MGAAGDDVNDERPTVPLETTPGGATERRRRRVWTFIGLAAVVTGVLAATVTVPGWQRTVALGAVVLGVVGLAAVKPLIKRAPKSAEGDENSSSWIYGMGGTPVGVIGQLIRSAGPDRGGFWVLVACGLAAALLVMPVLLACDAGLRLRRARKHAAAVSEPPNPRP